LSDNVVIVKTKTEYSNCGSCNKKACLWKGWNWFSPQAQMYCRSEILWYIHNRAEYFLMGVWPDCPWGITNALPTAKNPVSGLQAVVVPIGAVNDFSMMIEMRLDRCGKDGKLLIEQVEKWDENLSIPCQYSSLVSDAKMALNYCSTSRLRKQSYRKWKFDQKKKREKVV